MEKYDNLVDNVLVEAPGDIEKPFNIAKKALTKMAGDEGEQLFGGSGMMSNGYSSDKSYYPNIRASFMGWRNISKDKASTALIQRLNELKAIDTWNPEWSPEGTELQGMVSTQYSHEFIPNTEKAMQTAIDNLRASYERMPLNTDMQNEFDALLTELSEMDKASDPAAYKALEKKKNDLFAKLEARMVSGVGQGAQRKYEAALKRFGDSDPRTQQLKIAAREEEIALNKNISTPYTDQYGTPTVQAPAAWNTTGAAQSASVARTGAAMITMGQKAQQLAMAAASVSTDREKYTHGMGEMQQQHVNMMRQEFEKAFKKYESIMSARMSLVGNQGDQSVPGSANDQIDSPNEAIDESVLRNDGTIYRDQWGEFVSNVQNAVVGTSQRGYTAGGDLPSILRGRTMSSKFVKRGEKELSKLGTLDPALLKQVHNNTMVPLFLQKKPLLLYATQEQWESVSEGGRLGKGVTGLGSQAYAAGAGRPKVSL